MAEVEWLLCDLVTGDVLAELPLVGTSVAKAMSEESSASWTFGPTDDRTPERWYDLVEPATCMVVAVVDGTPAQAWPITGRTVSRSEAPTIEGPSLEGLLGRVYVRDYEAYGRDESFVCQDVAEQVFAPGFNFTTQAVAAGRVQDVYYDGTSDQTVLAILGEYGEGTSPVDFVCDVMWTPGYEGARVNKRLRIGPRLGVVQPEAVFDDASIVTYTRQSSFADGFGATRLWAVSDGAGLYRPIQGPFESSRLARLGPWESRPSFSTVQDDDELNARGVSIIATRQFGSTIWSFVCDLDRAPRVGVEWDVGDTVTFVVEPNEFDPVGGTFTGEVVGWELDAAANTITPRIRERVDTA